MRNLTFQGMLCAAACLSLVACGGPEEETAGMSSGSTANEVVSETAPADAPVNSPEKKTETASVAVSFDEMHLPEGEYYCKLMREGSDVDFHDLSTWKFIFVTELAGVPEKANVSYNGVVRDFEKSEAENRDDGVFWTYSEIDGEHTIELSLQAVEKGGEYTNYEGLMTLRESKGGEALASQPVWGSCGV